MADTPTAKLNFVRNIGIAAHIDAGKTTLTERVLFYTGAKHRIGEVHDAEAHMDYLPEERSHGITITSAVTRCPWRKHLIQVVDTPGHVDFTIEVERAMRVLDGAVIVLDGVRGVEPQTETVWRQAARFDIPRLIFVNKMDRPGASYERCLESLEKRLRAQPVPVTVPVEGGVIQLIEEQFIEFHGDNGEEVAVGPIPDEHLESFQTHRESLLLAAAESNPDLEDAVLAEEPIEPQAIWTAIKDATIAGNIHPVFGGTALRNQGVQPLLDGVIQLLPSPLDRPTVSGRSTDGEETEVHLDKSGTLAALAFKVQLWEGRRHVFVRIYRGTLQSGQQIRVAGTDTVERIARVFDVDAASKRRLDKAEAGQIALLAGLKKATTGDTLCDPGAPILLERIESRDPMLGLAIETQSSAEEEKLLVVMEKVCEEDPTLRFEEDEETGQRIIKGMGELHLQILFERLQREFGLKVSAGTPRVMTRETVLGTGNADVTIDRSFTNSDDKPVHLKARALATVRALGRGEGLQSTIEPQVEPQGTMLTNLQTDAVQAGTADALTGGPLEGAPLQDLAVEVNSIELFGAASSPQALRIAVSQAVRDALTEANSVVMSPLMKIEVVVPEENFGAVLGDLQQRNAAIMGSEAELEVVTVHGECALRELLGYATDLRSLTRGRGQFTMEFARFDIG